jgi:hypothetical protein
MGAEIVHLLSDAERGHDNPPKANNEPDHAYLSLHNHSSPILCAMKSTGGVLRVPYVSAYRSLPGLSICEPQVEHDA